MIFNHGFLFITITPTLNALLVRTAYKVCIYFFANFTGK
ncbi:hypothetical protein NU09_2697 [Flavobacterium beibuense]|uniref:Uncharacterized protein n=1 Tax=Flavobacterium beibuense TaxID=657326 RepID=A0A444W7M7_9FLAO|nr:hypothetical protein NU09_2697 [Flavobacterium beibuense]